ncbi:ABC transporter permease [Paenibacillus sp. BK033]|uniref:ABC transporter permease n=1 Tax=Paenibacillus sp. BK033 TaxID=2512133 RepID=UPI001405465A|nr:ABC transporter permease [Paenibacillus sp. BK033]
MRKRWGASLANALAFVKGRMWTELYILLRIQVAIVREQWIWIFIMATIFPLTTLLFMKFMYGVSSGQIMVNVIVGNIVFAIIMMGFNALGQEISWQKHAGYFTFYSSLPISKAIFVVTQLVRGLMTAMPSVIIMAFIGQFAYGIKLHYEWGLIPVFLLAVLSMVGIGAGIGFWSPDHQMTNMLVQGLMMFVGFLSPVMMEASQLPPVLRYIGVIFPTTYSASALREMLTKGWTPAVTMDMFVLIGFIIVSFAFISRMISWRAAE